MSVDPGSSGISPFRLGTILVRRRRYVLGGLLAALIIGVLYLTFRTPTYESTSAFAPQDEGSPLGEVAGLAQQFGVDLSQESKQRSPDFYVSLVTSRDVIQDILQKSFTSTDGASLTSHYSDEQDPLRRREEALRALRRDISTSVDRVAGIVTLSVEADDPLLGEELNRALLGAINEFDLGRRQSTARAEREFVEGRLTDLRDSLTTAEDRLQAFLAENRQFDNSPGLQFEHDRLERHMSMYQQLVATVAESFERARIAEVRNIPVITIVTEPSRPVYSSNLRAYQVLLIALLCGAITGSLLGLSVEWWHDAKSRDPYLAELRDELRAARGPPGDARASSAAES